MYLPKLSIEFTIKYMKYLILFLLFISSAFAKNIMFIGDSHSVGPFGQTVFKKLSKIQDLNIAMYAHSSSAAVHWTANKTYELGGGVNHMLTVDGKFYDNPNKTHWSVRRKVPHIEDILKELAYNESWKKEVGIINPIDTVIIALGANDLRAVSNLNGKLIKGSELRKSSILKMISEVEAIGAKCIWIGPPNGSSAEHSDARQKRLYQFLREAIGERCEFYSSNHFKAKSCDKIHFNCRAEIKNSTKWATEVTNFILKHI